jgi:hypothetical protein
MSKIDIQIEELLRKKKKINYLNSLLSIVKANANEELANIKEDMVSLFENFINTQIKNIEGDEIKVIPTQVNSNAPFKNETETKSVSNDNEVPPNEKINFALDYRHLGGKKVKVLNKEGSDSTIGEVVGLDAPYVVVKTSAGPTIRTKVDKIEVII